MNTIRLKTLLGLCMLFFTAVLCAQEAEPEELTKLRNGYVDAHVTAVEPLTKNYMQALADLKMKFSQAGKLREAIMVEAEEKGELKEDENSQPAKLIALRNIYERKKVQIAKDLKGKYLVALKKLQHKLSRAGNLQGASAVKAEYEKISLTDHPSDLPKNLEDCEKYLIGTGWSFKKGATDNPLTFKKGGEFSNKGLKCRYEVTGLREVTVIWPGNVRVRCQISEDWTKMTELDGGRGTLWRVAK